MPFIHRDGVSLYWRVDGNSDLPALVLGNSLGTDQSVWDCIMPGLLESFYVVRLDMRGHGASGFEPAATVADWSIATFAGDVLAVADAAGVSDFYFAGISIGGMIGLWLAAHAPRRVRGLLISNTAARLPAGVWPARIAAVQEAGMQALVDDTMSRWFTPAFTARGDATLATIRQNFLRVDPRAYAAVGAVLGSMDLHPLLERVAVPTTVVNGGADLSTPPVLGQAIAAALSDAICIELPVAHIPHPEVPQRFVTEIRKMVSRANASGLKPR